MDLQIACSFSITWLRVRQSTPESWLAVSQRSLCGQCLVGVEAGGAEGGRECGEAGGVWGGCERRSLPFCKAGRNCWSGRRISGVIPDLEGIVLSPVLRSEGPGAPIRWWWVCFPEIGATRRWGGLFQGLKCVRESSV